MSQYDNALEMRSLVQAIKECRQGVSYKSGPTDWYIHALLKAYTLKTSIIKGRYHLRPGTKVIIYRPKRREAIAPWFKDRVWQRSMCNNGVYDDLTAGFIYDNPACQRGKGTDLAIRRTVKMLHRIYQEDSTNTGYGVHLDVRKYFPSTPHGLIIRMDAEKISEKRYLPFLKEISESAKDPRPAEDVAADPHGSRGTGLGSQINQLHQVSLLNRIDHELKTFCRYYQRYMDDFLILDKDRSVCERARATIAAMLQDMGFDCVDKAGVFQIRRGFYFLRKRFVLTDTGKVLIKLHPSVPRTERRALLGMKEALNRGEITMDEVRTHYQSFIATSSYATGSGLIRDMDRFYTNLFRERPKYIPVRRHLHGNH